MCAGAIVNSRIKRVVCAAKDPRAGAFGSLLNLNFYPLNQKTSIEFGLFGGESSELFREAQKEITSSLIFPERVI